MSVVELVEISANKIVVKNHDLLDGTPILDIKPYLPYADSIPGANSGWTEGLAEYEVVFNEDLENPIEWLSSQLEFNLRNLLIQQLKFDPNLGRNKRVKSLGDRLFEFSYKTWRFNFLLENQQVRIIKMSSGYNSNDLIEGALDPWSDKELHRHFLRQFS